MLGVYEVDLDFDKYKDYQFCTNKKCGSFEKQGSNIGIKSRKNRQVYCKTCKSSWVITKDTFFYHLKTPVKEVLEVLKLLSEGMGVNAIQRTKGISPETMQDWIIKASNHVNEVSSYLKKEMNLTQCQIDEFWSFIRKKNQRSQKKNKTL